MWHVKFNCITEYLSLKSTFYMLVRSCINFYKKIYILMFFYHNSKSGRLELLTSIYTHKVLCNKHVLHRHKRESPNVSVYIHVHTYSGGGQAVKSINSAHHLHVLTALCMHDYHILCGTHI